MPFSASGLRVRQPFCGAFDRVSPVQADSERFSSHFVGLTHASLLIGS